MPKKLAWYSVTAQIDQKKIRIKTNSKNEQFNNINALISPIMKSKPNPVNILYIVLKKTILKTFLQQKKHAILASESKLTLLN